MVWGILERLARMKTSVGIREAKRKKKRGRYNYLGVALWVTRKTPKATSDTDLQVSHEANYYYFLVDHRGL